MSVEKAQTSTSCNVTIPCHTRRQTLSPDQVHHIQEKAMHSGSVHAGLAASAFFGVADFFGVTFLAAVFLTGVFFVVAGVLDLVTRPDLVLPSILGSSTIAGALYGVSRVDG